MKKSENWLLFKLKISREKKHLENILYKINDEILLKIGLTR